jgi:hypothetical protein
MNEELPTVSGARKPRSRSFWFVAFAILIIATVYFGPYVWVFYGVNRAAHQAVNEADEGFRKAKTTINPETLRVWALASIEHRTNWNEVYSSMPDYIRNLYADPPDVSIDGSCVVLMWGGGFFHWEIDIGPTNYVETTGVENIYTTVEWVPGIYYSREDTRHPFK